MTAPLFGLAIELPPLRSGTRLRELHRQLRAAILDGRLRPGLQLPASRELAALLHVSRNTVVAAYDLLLSEGYLVARQGSGTYVAEVVARPRRTATVTTARTASANTTSANKTSAQKASAETQLNPFWAGATAWAPRTLAGTARFDFGLGLPEKGEFPFPLWRSLSARALRGLSRTPASYSAPEGRAALRAAIAAHISFARAVACEADDVVVTAGAQQAFDLLARILVTPGRTTVAVEDPGYPPMRAALAAAGARIVSIPVDEEGLIVDRLPPQTRVIYVTPSHQFPLGFAMSLRRRAALLAFAQAHRAVIIEDDYDGEFRYEGRPLDALQTLDADGLVFYVGTFSKSLFPGLRLGFVIAPRWARQALIAAKQVTDWHSALLTQDTLATFIAEGHLVRHVRKMRKIYAARRAALLDALERHASHLLTPIASDAGLHLAAAVRADLSLDAESLAMQAADVGIDVHPVSFFTARPTATSAHDRRSMPAPTPPDDPRRNGLAFGFGLIAAHQMDDAIRELARVARIARAVRPGAPARAARR